MGKIVIDPITRIEGHLKIEVIVDDGEVKEARSSGTLFRGLELILKGRDPRDAQRITQRICGVCPTGHAMASTLNLDSAFGVDGKIPENGRIIRNLILGSNYLQSHILHFYHLAALDYVDVTAVAGYEGSDPGLNSVKRFIERGELGPFVPRYEGDYRLSPETNRQAVAHYLQALDIRRKAHEMLALFGGKMPHNVGIVPGGVTEVPTVDKIAAFLWRLNEIRSFIDTVYIPDVIAVATAYADHFQIGRGCGRFLSYGVFDLDGSETNLVKRKRLLPSGTVAADDLQPKDLEPAKIHEEVRHSWYADSSSGRHPSQGETSPQLGKDGAYSWLKSPRYDGQVHEVGPLARMLVAYVRGNETAKSLVDGALSALEAPVTALFSALGRHAARALETKLVADAMAGWVLQLKPGEPVYAEYELPDEAEGMGLTEAARGALGHWISIKDGRIANYQCVVPTTWNASPRDDRDQPGPIEQALQGTKVKDESNPFEVVRVVRSFDPCLACAVHLITPKGRSLGEFRVS
ncbi:MAG: nickel-dependent hydrogenase large subunit [Dehalococcoidia bacterium]|nr:nickel-dependent hydrogenase large subunit [Dehalococcoidia bacterium]